MVNDIPKEKYKDTKGVIRGRNERERLYEKTRMNDNIRDRGYGV